MNTIKSALCVFLLTLIIFMGFVYAGSKHLLSSTTTCSGYISVYYDANKNKELDSGDIKLSSDEYIVNNYLVLPKGVILKAEGTCTTNLVYHWCSNSAQKYSSRTSELLMSVSKVSRGCTANTRVVDIMSITPYITSDEDKVLLLDLYKSSFYSDSSLSTPYNNEEFNFFDVSTDMIPQIDSRMDTLIFEKIISRDILDGIKEYWMIEGEYMCEITELSTALLKISCSKEQIELVEDPETGEVSEVIVEKKYVGYLSLESLFLQLEEKNLVDINIERGIEIEYDCPEGSSTPQVIKSNSKVIYLEEAGLYSCVFSPKPSSGKNNCIFLAD